MEQNKDEMSTTSIVPGYTPVEVLAKKIRQFFKDSPTCHVENCSCFACRSRRDVMEYLAAIGLALVLMVLPACGKGPTQQGMKDIGEIGVVDCPSCGTKNYFIYDPKRTELLVIECTKCGKGLEVRVRKQINEKSAQVAGASRQQPHGK